MSRREGCIGKFPASAVLGKRLSSGVQLAAGSLVPCVCVCRPVKNVPLR